MPRYLQAFALAFVLGAPLARAQENIAKPLSLTIKPDEQVCAGTLAPPPWRDASDARFFATGPTARLDMHELWAGSLEPLAALRYAAGVLHLMVLGMPTQTQIRFTSAGWRPRWPFC
ncbi:MAG TPA: hypothetical protein VMK66_16010 [Myxococcales bacterium]|nr:hypothetical protein [Myxococcales bacterium]